MHGDDEPCDVCFLGGFVIYEVKCGEFKCDPTS